MIFGRLQVCLGTEFRFLISKRLKLYFYTGFEFRFQNPFKMFELANCRIRFLRIEPVSKIQNVKYTVRFAF